MNVALIPVVVKILFMVIEYFASRKIVDQQSKKVFIQMAEELRKIGIANVKSRYEAEDQIQAGDDEWTSREAATLLNEQSEALLSARTKREAASQLPNKEVGP